MAHEALSLIKNICALHGAMFSLIESYKCVNTSVVSALCFRTPMTYPISRGASAPKAFVTSLIDKSIFCSNEVSMKASTGARDVRVESV